MLLGDVLAAEGQAHANTRQAPSSDVHFLPLRSPRRLTGRLRSRTPKGASVASTVLINDVAPVAQETDSGCKRTMAVNAAGVYDGMRAVILAMRHAGGGSIINIASIHAPVGGPGNVASTAGNGAVIAITKVVALEHAAHGVRVNASNRLPIDGGYIRPLNQWRRPGPGPGAAASRDRACRRRSSAASHRETRRAHRSKRRRRCRRNQHPSRGPRFQRPSPLRHRRSSCEGGPDDDRP